jgi:hypothetical protein
LVGLGSVVPIRRQAVAAGVYEDEIEGLLWDNLEDLTGDNLFRVARQPVLALGRPDVVALDATERIVVIEVKRDVDRGQVAQALEYAGWARGVRLDDLTERYHGGPGLFWEDWLEFTGSTTPVLVQQDPRLMLVARSFEPRTLQALEFLQRHRVPVKLLRVAFYPDDDGRRFLDVEWESEPEVGGVPGAPDRVVSPVGAQTCSGPGRSGSPMDASSSRPRVPPWPPPTSCPSTGGAAGSSVMAGRR